jgi:hypothetical protein
VAEVCGVELSFVHEAEEAAIATMKQFMSRISDQQTTPPNTQADH